MKTIGPLAKVWIIPEGVIREITSIDFEYFGWDDPVKLTADFLWHPAMELDPEIAVEWEKAMTDLFYGDPDFKKRLRRFNKSAGRGTNPIH